MIESAAATDWNTFSKFYWSPDTEFPCFHKLAQEASGLHTPFANALFWCCDDLTQPKTEATVLAEYKTTAGTTKDMEYWFRHPFFRSRAEEEDAVKAGRLLTDVAYDTAVQVTEAVTRKHSSYGGSDLDVEAWISEYLKNRLNYPLRPVGSLVACRACGVTYTGTPDCTTCVRFAIHTRMTEFLKLMQWIYEQKSPVTLFDYKPD